MADVLKRSGGSRNYSQQPSTLKKRREEFDRKMATGEYDVGLSYFDPTGGYILVHKGHNPRKDDDREDLASEFLAASGYVVELADETSTVSYEATRDGTLYKSPMDIKTINTAGNSTMKGSMEHAAAQGAKTVVIMQNTPDMDRAYVESQINKFITKSPKRSREQLEWVIVVGQSGNIHRRKLK